MVQPYLQRIDHEGETSLVFIGGAFSHAVRKSAVLDGPDNGVDRRFLAHGGVNVRPRTPTRAQLAVAHRALAAVSGGPTRLLYARVDLVPGPNGEPLLIELELTEPQLYFELFPEAASRFTAAVVEKRRNPKFVTATDGSRRHCDGDSAAFTSGGSKRVRWSR